MYHLSFFVRHSFCYKKTLGPYQRLRPLGGHKSLLKKSVSHSEKIQSVTTPPQGVLSGQVTVSRAFSREESLERIGGWGAKSLFHFGGHPSGGVLAQT